MSWAWGRCTECDVLEEEPAGEICGVCGGRLEESAPTAEEAALHEVMGAEHPY